MGNKVKLREILLSKQGKREGKGNRFHFPFGLLMLIMIHQIIGRDVIRIDTRRDEGVDVMLPKGKKLEVGTKVHNFC